MHGAVLLLVDDALRLPFVEDVGCSVIVDELLLSRVEAGLQLGNLLGLPVQPLLSEGLRLIGCLDLGLGAAPAGVQLEHRVTLASGTAGRKQTRSVIGGQRGTYLETAVLRRKASATSGSSSRQSSLTSLCLCSSTLPLHQALKGSPTTEYRRFMTNW